MTQTITANDFESQRPTAPFRALRFGPVDMDLHPRADGSFLLSNRQALGSFGVTQIADYLRHHANAAPERCWLAEPSNGGWRRLSYGQARQQVDALSQWLLNRQIPADRPILILSDNGIHHALLQMAAMQIGLPVLAISPAYSLMSESCNKVVELVRRFEPALIYAADVERYGRALALAKPLSDALVLCDSPAVSIADASFDEALSTVPTDAVEHAYARVGLDTIARLLLTSGSTGAPKAVTMTQRNIIASGTLWDQVWPFLEETPPVMVDWLPWNHTAGVHGAFSMVLRHGGTLYIDDGKPTPDLIDRSIRHLREIRPNIMVNVPRGLDMLAARMEEDLEIAVDIFSKLDIIVYGGASLSPNTLLKLEQLSAQATGYRIPISSSLGSTETTMPATLIWWPPEIIGTLGLPAPGVVAKLIPDGERYEIRFRGPNITTGYYRDVDANRAAFDEEGFLRTGDAVTFARDDDPRQGLVYAGRLSENFKLSTGTWVSVASVRGNLLSTLHPLLTDVVLAGHDRDQLGALLFINPEQVRKRLPQLAAASLADLATEPSLLALLAEGISAYNTRYPGSSTRIARALLLTSPPSIDAGELTDKGHINQRGVLKIRAESVLRLYAAKQTSIDCIVFA